MALENGAVRLPEDREPWGPQIYKLCTPKGIKAFELALSIFAPHTVETLSGDPALNLEIRARANEHIEAAVKGFIVETIKNYLSKGVLDTDPLIIASKLDQAIEAKYPENSRLGEPFGEAFVLNEIRNRVLSYLMAIVASNEGAHRRKTTKQKKGGHLPTHDAFFSLIDSPAFARILAQDNGKLLDLLEATRESYRGIKELLIPFLRGKVGFFKNPENKTREELKAENDKIGTEVVQKIQKTIPMCTIEDDDLLEDKRLILRFGPIDKSLHGFSAVLADVGIFDEDLGQIIAASADMQREMQPVRTIMQDVKMHIGYLPSFVITRFGDLQSGRAGHETLRMLSGERPNYELVRRKLLWYLAQLTCRQGDVETIFGVEFLKRKKHNPSSTERETQEEPTSPKSPRGDATPPANPGTGVDRYYPAERVQRSVSEAIDNIKRRKTMVEGHTRLLPVIRRPNGTIVSCKPSNEAKKLAENEGVSLDIGLEILSSSQVVYPEEMESFLAELGAVNIEEVIALDPENIVTRHETWVKRHEVGNVTDETVEAVHAHVREVAKST